MPTRRPMPRHMIVLLSLAFVLGAARAFAQPPSDTAGQHIAPGITFAERFARVIPDGEGGAYIGFESAVDQTSVVARIGPYGGPVPEWHPTSFSGVNRLNGQSNYRVGIARGRPGAVWMGADFAFGTDTYVRLIHRLGPTVPDTVVTPIQNETHTGLMNLNPEQVFLYRVVGPPPMLLKMSVLGVDGVMDNSIPDAILPGTNVLVSQQDLQSVPDGAGGAFLGMRVNSASDNTFADLATTRHLANGVPAWSPAFRVLTSAVRDQTDLSMAPDGSGGAYYSWTSLQNLTLSAEIYGMHLLADGTRATGWAAGGRLLSTGTGDQFQPEVVGDGLGGFWMAWTDSRSGANDIHYARFLATGALAPGYPAGGLILCGETGSQIEARVLADGAGGMFVVWLDARDGELVMYGQHINSLGQVAPGWTAGGSPLCTNAFAPSEVQLVANDSNGMLVVWSDSRNGVQQYYSIAVAADGVVTGVPRLTAGSLRLRATGRSHELAFVLDSADAGDVRVALFDVAGRQIAEQRRAGPLSGERVVFETERLSPGIYLARALQGGRAATSRGILLQ